MFFPVFININIHFKLYYTLIGYKDKHIRRLSLITTLIWFFTAKYVDPLFYGHNIYPNV